MPAEPEAWETTEEPMKPEEIERLSSESRTRRVGTKRRYFSTVCLCIRGIVSVLIGLCHVFLVDETLDFWSTRLSIDITVPGKGKANKGAITGWADLDGDAAMPRIVRRLAYGTGVCLVVWGIFCVFTVFKLNAPARKFIAGCNVGAPVAALLLVAGGTVDPSAFLPPLLPLLVLDVATTWLADAGPRRIRVDSNSFLVVDAPGGRTGTTTVKRVNSKSELHSFKAE